MYFFSFPFRVRWPVVLHLWPQIIGELECPRVSEPPGDMVHLTAVPNLIAQSFILRKFPRY